MIFLSYHEMTLGQTQQITFVGVIFKTLLVVVVVAVRRFLVRDERHDDNLGAVVVNLNVVSFALQDVTVSRFQSPIDTVENKAGLRSLTRAR